MQLTTYKSWQEVGTWYANLERERRIPDSAVKAEADTLVKGKSDDMAKVKALYDYVSRNIRYVSLSFGLGRIQPHAASEVLANGYGDCKDKNTLLAALLEAEGFKSTSVLIGSQRKLDPDVPSPMQFDHVITRVPVDGKEIWLDSTPGVAPFRMLSSNLRGKQALAISPDGKAELVWTPTDLPFEAFDRTTLEGTVSDAGKLTAHVSMTGRGDTEMMLRFAMRRMPSNRWKDIFDYMLQRTKLRGAEITNVNGQRSQRDRRSDQSRFRRYRLQLSSIGRRRNRSSRCRCRRSTCLASTAMPRMTTTMTAPRMSPSSWARLGMARRM